MLRFVVLLAVVLPVTASAISAQPTEWLERMSRAGTAVNYQGEFVFVRGDLVRHMGVVHTVDSKGVQEKIYSVDGPAVEMTIGNQPGQQYADSIASRERGFAGSESGLLSSRIHESFVFSRFPPQLLSRLTSLYEISLGGEDRVANHFVQIVELTPLDSYRFGLKLWLEKETALLLKAAMIDAQNNILEQFSYSRIAIEPATNGDVSRLQPTEASKSTEVGAGSSEWEVTNAPLGFKLHSVNRYPAMPAGNVDHLIYTDGMAMVSVFVEPPGQKGTSGNGAVRLGVVNAVVGNVASRQVTVMGEVPEATLQMMLDSVTPVNTLQ